MATITMRELLEAGVHFGHQTRRWNPKMKQYIFLERNRIHIIDLARTLQQVDKAREAVIKVTQAETGSCSSAPRSRPRPSCRKRRGAAATST